MKSGREPVASLRLPPYAPASLTPLVERFDALGTEWAACKGEIADAQDALERLKAENVRSAGEALAEGKNPPDGAKAEAKAEAALAALRRRLAELAVAVDIAGNQLAKAVAAERDNWLASLEPVEAEQVSRMRGGLTAAKDASDVLGSVRAARVWLEEFDPSLAIVGRQRQHVPGGALRVDARKARLDRNRTPSVRELLDLAASVLEEPEAEPVWYAARSAAERSFAR